ncbi:MAG: RNA polymerase sigma factor [Paracoccaceae bacterium]
MGEQDDAAAAMRDLAHRDGQGDNLGDNRGDDRALARLVALYGRPFTIFAGRYLGDPAQGEDVAQEVFLRAWAEARRYDPARGSVAAWLFRIAANLCADRHRRARLRHFFLGPDPGDLADTLGDDARGPRPRSPGAKRSPACAPRSGPCLTASGQRS